MTAHDQIRAMLDELMGTTRDGDSDRYRVRFDDPRVCKSFLLSCCPHDILASTRMDLGECPNVHDLALRADYELAAKTKDYFYDIDAMEHLQSFISDCDRKTEVAKRRLKETQEELSEEANSKAEQIHSLGEQIGTLMAKAEEVGAAGEVEESMKMLEEVEALKGKKSQAETEFRNSMPASSYQQQKLRVCEVCGAYLGIHDNDRRLADHFGGKLHLGFITIREKLDQLKTLVTERRAQREAQREEMRQRREMDGGDGDRNRGGAMAGGSRSPSRGYDRGDADRSTRDRSRDRDRERDRRRSRSRDRHRRRRSSRSRERGSRKRSKRSRSRSRRSRSTSRGSRHRRSRSRSHSRRKHRRRSHSGSRPRNGQRSRSKSRSAERSGRGQESQAYEESAD
ncbi:putative RNA-binding protein Luc7-like 1 isoform X1 [Aplysia californica]|uniref:RNA-binding protein Luc7-like 1 isoform X1 n=2 Tax=Aplysia californica TaxID=6500 RepID=A0ABM0JFL0_APLCA|nr:putative RNA-binding protein Luc7-like 1 isoform X1 [Aplysia californica]